MSDEERPDEEPSAAEERVLALLTLLRTDAGRDDPTLVATVMRHLRFQRAVREALTAVGAVAGAVSDGVAVILGVPRRDGGRNT